MPVETERKRGHALFEGRGGESEDDRWTRARLQDAGI